MKRAILQVLLVCMVICFCMTAEARKTGYKLKVQSAKSGAAGYAAKDTEMTKGSFMVSSQCEDCNNGYRLDQISFSGFDKPQSSTSETFFISNHTDHIMTGVTLYIEYLTPDGRQLNKRFVKLVCNIPPGETRNVSINSWDKQKSFYYEKSTPSKRTGTPFTVVFDPISFYLRF